MCKWRHIQFGFQATAHRQAADLAVTLKKIKAIWLEVGKSFQAEVFLGKKAEKKCRSELLSKTACLSLIGSWGRTENYRHSMITTSHPDDIPFNGEISSKPTPHSETTNTGYVFHDVTFNQRILSLGTFLTLNLLARNQGRLQVARILHQVLLTTDPRRIISIQVDAVYVQFQRSEAKKLERRFKTLKYCDLNSITSPLQRSWANVRSTPNPSQELVYKCNLSEPRYPGGSLTVAPHSDPPSPEILEWVTHVEPKEGPDEFVEKVLEHVRKGRSFTCLGAPGTGKSKGILTKVREELLASGERVVCLAPTHAAARLLPDGDTVHHFVGKFAMKGSFIKGWILLDEISMCCLYHF